MSDRFGLIIAEDGNTTKDLPAKLDSRTKHIIVDLERTPTHLQLIDPMTRGTVLANDGSRHQETLGNPIKHNLGYTPLVFTYFQLLAFETTGGLGYNSIVGGYSGDYYNIGGTGTITDFFTVEADNTEVRLVHLQDGPNIGYVSQAPFYKFKVKLYICSVDIGVPLYTGLESLT